MGKKGRWNLFFRFGLGTIFIFRRELHKLFQVSENCANKYNRVQMIEKSIRNKIEGVKYSEYAPGCIDHTSCVTSMAYWIPICTF